jgi:putative transposase
MSTLIIANLNPIIQTTIKYLGSNDYSFQSIGNDLGISKQAVQKQVKKGFEFLASYDEKFEKRSSRELDLEKEINYLKNLIQNLRREHIIKSVQMTMSNWVIEKIKDFLPKISFNRFTVYQKKYLLDMCDKFVNSEGAIKEFCSAINKSPVTLNRWKKAYHAKGIGGLADKQTMPKNFGNKITLFVKQQLIALFLKFPYWDDYQCHKYIRFNPATNYYVSLPTIRKLKNAYKLRSQDEKERLKKRWAFAPGTDCWTVDFTCILKTKNYKLQLFTVSDQRSRFLFESVLFLETSTDQVINHLKELFIKYGRPNIIKADNGPEFKTDCKEKLNELMVYLFNSPTYYAKFNGAHERIHKTLKKYISDFESHKNITLLVQEINLFLEEYNYKLPHEYLDGKTPSEVYFNDKDFVPKNTNTEIIKTYEKDRELRFKFTNRKGNQARISIPLIEN